jgi:hypothetical protein
MSTMMKTELLLNDGKTWLKSVWQDPSTHPIEGTGKSDFRTLVSTSPWINLCRWALTGTCLMMQLLLLTTIATATTAEHNNGNRPVECLFSIVDWCFEQDLVAVATGQSSL